VAAPAAFGVRPAAMIAGVNAKRLPRSSFRALLFPIGRSSLCPSRSVQIVLVLIDESEFEVLAELRL
jgi:hypothetical protein